MLLTHHILFVGYSLSDPNFRRIAHDVALATRTAGTSTGPGAQFGTVLTPTEPGAARRRLWQEELEFLSTGEAGRTGPPTRAATRRIEILVDRLVAESTQPVAFLTNDRYGDLLTAEERAVADSLKALQKALHACPAPLRRAFSEMPGLG